MINTNFKEYFEDVIVECHPVDNYDQNWLFKCEDYTLVLIDKKEGLINLGIVIEKLQFTQKSIDLLLLFCSNIVGLDIESDTTYKQYLAKLNFAGIPQKRSQFSLQQLLEFYESGMTCQQYIREQLKQQIKQSYILTYDNILKETYIFPVLITSQQILKFVTIKVIQQYTINQQEVDYLLTELNKDPYFQDSSDYINKSFLNILIKVNHLLLNLFKFSWKLTKDLILSKILQVIQDDISIQSQYFQQFFQNRFQDYQEELFKYINILIENSYEFIETMISQLQNEKLNSQLILASLTEQIECQLNRITYDFYDLAHLEFTSAHHIVQELFLSIKDVYTQIAQDFLNYLLKVSLYCNSQLAEMELLLEQNSTLCNNVIYVHLFREVSQHLLKQSDLFLEEQWFYRPEFKQIKIGQLTIQYFYNLVEQLINPKINCKNQCSGFVDQFKKIGVIIEYQIPQTIQIIENEQKSQVNILRDYENLQISKSIKLTNDMRTAILINIEFENIEETFLLEIIDQCFVFISNYNLDLWQRINEPPQAQDKVSLITFINQSIKYLNQIQIDNQTPDGTEDKDESIQQANSRGINLRNTMVKKKKFKVPKKPIKYRQNIRRLHINVLATSIGIFIVNCFNDDITLKDNLRIVGKGAAFTVTVTLISARLPYAGIVIQLLLLTYAIFISFSNTVICKKEIYLNLFYFSILIMMIFLWSYLTSIYITSTIWKFVITGVIGAIWIYSFQSYVLPKFKDNLINMFNSIEDEIGPNGKITLNENIIKKMQFDYVTFQKLKGTHLNDDQFLVLVLYCLVQALLQLNLDYYDKQIEKYNKKKKSTNELRKRKIDIQIELLLWSHLKQQILANNLVIYDHIPRINKFLEGMLEHFNIYR